MKKLAAVTAAAMAIWFAMGVAFAAAPDNALVLKSVLSAPKKAPVTFEHRKHAELKCAECHHKDEAGKEQGCRTCHGEKAVGKAPDQKEALHGNCKECHVKAKKGPAKSDDCHKK